MINILFVNTFLMALIVTAIHIQLNSTEAICQYNGFYVASHY